LKFLSIIMKYWVLVGIVLVVVLVLGCTSSTNQNTNEATGMAVVNKVITDKAKVSSCISYCLDLNKDSSRRSIDTWFNVNPTFCSNNCINAGIKCTVVFHNGLTCEVNCAQNNTAYCY